jgi:uncharacterized protein (UPF0276 family)
VRPLFGVGWRRPLAEGLAADPPEVLEVVPDHFFASPSEIEALADLCPLVLHDVGSSVATEERDPQRLARLRDLVSRCRPILFSDHLALTRSPSGVDLGHLAPIWRTRAQLDVVVDRVKELQDVMGVPVALENIASPFEIPGGLDEADFFGELVGRTGCGLLIDVTNALYDARNGGPSPEDRLSRLPLESAWQVHLAGGGQGRPPHAWWIDSHAAPVEAESYALLRMLRERAPLKAVIVERDAHLPAASELLAEARRAKEVWLGSR